jgi:hypothetical protein
MASVLEYGVSGFSEAPYSRAELFDAAAYGADPHALRWLLDHFEIIARPRHRLGVALRRGDILLRRGESALAHAAIIVDPEMRSALGVVLAGGTVENGAPGTFAYVAERGARPHEEHERFARRIIDEDGRLLGRQIILRAHEGAGESEGVDPMSLVVGMTIANMGARPVTRVEVVNPAPALAPPPEWKPPSFDSEAGTSGGSDSGSGTQRRAPARRSGWPAAGSRPITETEALPGLGESDANALAEFNSPEHFRLGSGIQQMVDSWAKAGLISGGCFVADTDASGEPLPFAQWQFYLPDRAHLTQPYGTQAMRNAHWHWITPHAHHDENGHTWTATSLATALRNGRALTLSVGDLIMMSGDLIGEFADYAAASSPSWRAQPVNIARGVAQGDPFAFAIIRRLQFPRTGAAAARDVQMLYRAGHDAAAAKREVQSSDSTWTAIRHMVQFLRKVAGTSGYHQLLVISRLMRGKRLSIEHIERVAPWVNAADYTQFLTTAGMAGTGFGRHTDFDSDMLQMIVTNGAYAELAMNNERHFSPSNWQAFETAHTQALQLIDRQVPITGVTIEYAPIPANAIAQLAYGMHFLTDAFAAGHMRTPRRAVGRSGSLLSGVMHDLENDLGLTVQNGFNQRWRAFGDSHLDTSSLEQRHLLAGIAYYGRLTGKAIDTNFMANRDHALAAVGAAMKQLHYQAQKYFGDTTNAADFQPILQATRGNDSGLLYDDAVSNANPGDGSRRDGWIAMDIAAKIRYMRKHQPVPLPSGSGWLGGTANHPPLAEVDSAGHIVFDRTGSYSLDQHLAADPHVLYQLDLRDAGDFSQNITDYVVLMAMTPDSALSWAGAREYWLGQAIEHWPDKRGWRDAVLRWYANLTELGLP